VAVSAEVDGHKVPEEKVKEAKVTLVISNGRFTATARSVFTNEKGMKSEATLKGVIKLDSTKQPGEFDLVDCRIDAGKLKDVNTSGLQGIYELKGDTLKVCYGPKRPTDFKTKPYSHQKLYFFKREKPKEADGKSDERSKPARVGKAPLPNPKRVAKAVPPSLDLTNA
jgi:uncharacterized protein (TIGR03067 family)